MMYSSNALRLFLVVVAACNAVTSAEDAVDLGRAGDFVILTKTGITTTGVTEIVGDIAVSPIAATFMTGFTLIMDSSNTFSTSALITGQAFAPGYVNPTPATLTTAVNDMNTAFVDAAGRPNPDAARINLNTGLLGGARPGGPHDPLTAGVYTFGTGVSIGGDLHFTGNEDSVFIIQMAGNLVLAADVEVILDGVLASNIFWQISGNVSVGARAHLEGILLVKTGVTFVTGSTLNGRVLAQTMCALQSAVIKQPPAIAATAP
jgi:hypothetical protein